MRRFALGLLVVLSLASWAAPARASTAFGTIESPTAGATVFGVVPVRGWFLDVNPVSSIQILVDGPCAPAVSGCNDAIIAQSNISRPDVIASFPAFAGGPTADPGFEGSFLSSQFANGSHTITAVATEEPSNPVTIASVTVNVVNGIDQPPFGAINIPTSDPGVVTGANAAFLVLGWALDDQAVDHVDVLVDGQVVVRAFCCGPRPDVQAAFPAVPNSLFSGWSAYIDSTSLINGTHTVAARATDNQGASSIIGVRTVQVDNASLNLHPFGEIDAPLDESTVSKTVCGGAPPVVSSGGCPISPPQVCEVTSTGCLSVNRSNLNPVSGWVLDTGARLDLGQAAYVQLLIDGVIIADTRQDCVLLSGAYANCYGVNRPDVEKRFPGFVNSDNAGFVFDFAVVDDGTGHLGIFIPAGSGTAATACLREVTTIVPGKHDISVRAGDVAETVSLIGTPLSMDFTTGCTTTSVDQPAFGNIETPSNFQFLSGSTTVSGWAFDPDGFSCDSLSNSHIDVDVDGHYVDIVTRQVCGVPCPPTGCVVLPNCEPESPGGVAEWCGVRPDVPIHDIRVPPSFATGFTSHSCTTQDGASWIAGAAKVGWSFTLDTTKLANSAHDLNVYATDINCNRILIGRRKFVVFNDPTRGAITIPGEVHVAPVVRGHP